MRRGRVNGERVRSRVPFGGRVNGLADGLDVDMRKPGELGFWLESASGLKYYFLRWEPPGKMG